MNLSRNAIRLVACASVLVLLHGCAHGPKKPEKALSQQGVEAAIVLGRFLSPETWDEAKRTRLIKAVTPLEYHGETASGKTVIHAKFEIANGPLRELLADSKAANSTFTSDGDMGRASGPDSHKAIPSDDGGSNLLSWWKPGKERRITHYFWIVHPEKKPHTRVWLQEAERGRGKRLVYVGIENQ